MFDTLHGSSGYELKRTWIGTESVSVLNFVASTLLTCSSSTIWNLNMIDHFSETIKNINDVKRMNLFLFLFYLQEFQIHGKHRGGAIP